jgi:hypothetical protein
MNQLRLLGCQFVPCDLPSEPRIGQGTTRLQNHKVQQKLIRIAKALQQRSDDPSSKKAAIKSLVRAYNFSSDLKTHVVDLHLSSIAAANTPTRYLPSVPFSFGERVVAHVQLDGVYSVNPDEAIFAFFHLESLNVGREASLSKKPHKRENEPVARLRDKKLRARQPENAFEDPFIVAALIALAQAQRWFQTESDKAAQPVSSEEAQPSSNASTLFTVRLSVRPHGTAHPQVELDTDKIKGPSASRHRDKVPALVYVRGLNFFGLPRPVEETLTVLTSRPGPDFLLQASIG